MALCDVNNPNCIQDTEESQVCGSCMRNICDGCTEHLTTIADDYGNHYMVPISMGDENSFGKVPVCPACAHLETFKTTDANNRQAAIEHIIAKHPEGALEDVDKHGELDDYHDALHYGDVNEDTAGQAPYPMDHEDSPGRLAKTTLTNEFTCSDCGNTGLPINLQNGEEICSNCAKAKPSESSLKLPPGSPPTGPTGVPTTPNPSTPITYGVDPNDPIDLSEHRETRKRHGIPGSLLFSNPDRSHKYADFPSLHPETQKKSVIKAWKNGALHPEQEVALAAKVHINNANVKHLMKQTGGVDEKGHPVHGVHKEHFDCEAQGGTKLLPGMMCHRCGSASLQFGGKLIDAGKAGSYGTPFTISPFDDEEKQAKAMGIQDMWFKHRSDWTATQKAKYDAEPKGVGRPASLGKWLMKRGISYNPESPVGGTFKFAHKYVSPDHQRELNISLEDFNSLIKGNGPEHIQDATVRRSILESNGTPHQHDPDDKDVYFEEGGEPKKMSEQTHINY